jgi:hypothetical protein
LKPSGFFPPALDDGYRIGFKGESPRKTTDRQNNMEIINEKN